MSETPVCFSTLVMLAKFQFLATYRQCFGIYSNHAFIKPHFIYRAGLAKVRAISVHDLPVLAKPLRILTAYVAIEVWPRGVLFTNTAKRTQNVTMFWSCDTPNTVRCCHLTTCSYHHNVLVSARDHGLREASLSHPGLH